MLPLPVLAVGFDDLAQLAIFAILAIGAAIQHAIKKKAEQARRAPGPRRPEPGHGHGHEELEHRRPPPLPPSPPPRPTYVPRPTATQVERAASPVLASIPVAGPAPAAHAHHGGRLTVSAEPRKRSRALSGRGLLFARNATPHDRVRAAVLWSEVLRPPPALGG
jgi:hypothetical protein